MTSPVTAALRRLVMQRAHGRCEYCLLREEDSAFNLQVEHFISEKHGGATISENLASACVFCNRWSDHFQIDGALIVAITEVAEATTRLLRFNSDDRQLERTMLQASGRYPKQSPSP